MRNGAIYPFAASAVRITVEVRKGRTWYTAIVAGLDDAHARERAIEILGWAPIIRIKDTQEVIWNKQGRP